VSEYFVDSAGYYGEFGGAYVPEMLHRNIEELCQCYQEIIAEAEFQVEFKSLLKNFVGRPTALYEARNLSRETGLRVFLKREDLNHTGAHKINNALGQALLAKRLNKTRIIAETGAGQHGVATATACALLGIKCIVYMGEIDIQRQEPNVKRMLMLGAEVRSVTSGSKVLKDATNEAIRDWISNPFDTHYIIGSAVGPHPFPDLVSRFQSVISEEVKQQLATDYQINRPDYVLACVGGGSNAIGAFYHYIDDPMVKLIGVEAAGEGVNSGRTAATIALGKEGVLHGCKTLIMQDLDGQIEEAHSVSAGLDYPGIGPQHAHLSKTGRVTYVSITDAEALQAALHLSRTEGIIPALESSHALAYLPKLQAAKGATIVLCLSGRGDKDLPTYIRYLDGK
jgi:tryptophan synthase beta chain